MDASDNSWRRYSELSITTSPDLLSGLVMTISIVRWRAEVSWKVSVLCLEGSSVLRIVGLRPPIFSNHRFRDEVQGSRKPSQGSFHFNR